MTKQQKVLELRADNYKICLLHHHAKQYFSCPYCTDLYAKPIPKSWSRLEQSLASSVRFIWAQHNKGTDNWQWDRAPLSLNTVEEILSEESHHTSATEEDFEAAADKVYSWFKRFRKTFKLTPGYWESKA